MIWKIYYRIIRLISKDYAETVSRKRFNWACEKLKEKYNFDPRSETAYSASDAYKTWKEII